MHESLISHHQPSLPLYLSLSTSNPQYSTLPLLSLSKPLLNPSLHLRSARSIANVDRRYDLLNPQRAHEHCQLSEGTMFAVRNTKARSLFGTSTLGNEVCHCEGRAPGEDGWDTGCIGESGIVSCKTRMGHNGVLPGI